MWPIEWHQYQWPWVTVKVTSAVRNGSVPNTSENTASINDDMFIKYTWIEKRKWLVISTVLSKLNDISKSQTVAYKIEMLLHVRQITVGSDTWHIKLRHFRWPWVTFNINRSLQAYSNAIFWTVVQCNSWQDFNWRSAWRDRSRITSFFSEHRAFATVKRAQQVLR